MYSVKDVGFQYEKKWILKDISLTIKRGEILGIIGPNGAGKTTLLKILGKILQAKEGGIAWGGKLLSRIPIRAYAREVAMISQEHQMVFPYTALEVVLMGRYPYLGGWAFETEEDHTIARLAMEKMEVEGFAFRLFNELSGGEKQRVMIARALAQKANVLLLDEPATFLDLRHQMGIFSILKALNRDQGMTLVMVSHDLNMASQFCHQLLLLDRGRMVQWGTPETVLTAEKIREIYRCEVIVDFHPGTGKPRVTPGVW